MKLFLFFLVFYSLLMFPRFVSGISGIPEASLSKVNSDQTNVPVGTNLPPNSRLIKDEPTEGKALGKEGTDKQNLETRRLLSIGIRAAFSNDDVLGAAAREGFREFGLAATFRLPWGWYSSSNWGVGLRLMTGLGALYTVGDTALVVSLIPLVAFGSKDGRFTVDMGTGGALLSKRQFGKQDFGGYLQFALTAGVGLPLYKQLGAGYRYLHYSDAGIYGRDTIGADMHMLELTYRF